MRVEDTQFLFEYNYWARDRILDNVAKLSSQQFFEPKTYSHGSIRNTLVHILSAEWVWRVRCQENFSPTDLFSLDDFPSLESIKRKWLQEEKCMRNYLRGLTDQVLDRAVLYKRTGGQSQENTFWHLLVHVVNHGTEHRSIIAADLTEFGFSPGDLDMIHFLRARFDKIT